MPQTDLATRFPNVTRGVRWRNTALIGARTVTGIPDASRLQSVNMVPFAGDDVLVITLENGRVMLPGGTRERGESLFETISREMREETGYAIDSCFPYLILECISYDARPWRPWLVHPEFERLVCLGDVHRVSEPENPADAEQIAHVHLMPLDDAVRFLHDAGRAELADVYAFAGEVRANTGALINLAAEEEPCPEGQA